LDEVAWVVILEGHMNRMAVWLVGGGCRPIVPGAVVESDQVLPPSMLISVKTSKKLPI
jgi:hypothetical protein